MARVHFWGRAVDSYGNIKPDTGIKIYLTGTLTPATIYENQTGGVGIATIPQQTTDSSGRFDFWIDDDDYLLTQLFDIVVDELIYDKVDIFRLAIVGDTIYAVSAASREQDNRIFEYIDTTTVSISAASREQDQRVREYAETLDSPSGNIINRATEYTDVQITSVSGGSDEKDQRLLEIINAVSAASLEQDNRLLQVFTVSGAGIYSQFDKFAIEMEMEFKAAQQNYYKELTYLSVGALAGSLVDIDIYTDNTKLIQLFHKDLYYNLDNNLSRTLLLRNSDLSQVAKYLTYNASDQLINIEVSAYNINQYSKNPGGISDETLSVSAASDEKDQRLQEQIDLFESAGAPSGSILNRSMEYTDYRVNNLTLPTSASQDDLRYEINNLTLPTSASLEDVQDVDGQLAAHLASAGVHFLETDIDFDNLATSAHAHPQYDAQANLDPLSAASVEQDNRLNEFIDDNRGRLVSHLTSAGIHSLVSSTQAESIDESTLRNWKTMDTLPGDFKSGPVLVFKDRLWTLGGNWNGVVPAGGPVYSSPDGINWEKTGEIDSNMTQGTYWGNGTVFDGKMWYFCGTNFDLGGFLNTGVYNSEDGETWTKVSDNSLQRYLAAATTFDNKIWVLGGIDETFSNVSDEVYWTVDGITFNLAGNTPAPRSDTGWQKASIVNFNDKLWLVGGATGGTPGNEPYPQIFYTVDGSVWTSAGRMPDAGDGVGKAEGSCFEYGGRLWYIGGYEQGGNTPSDDIYVSDTQGFNWIDYGKFPTALDEPTAVPFHGRIYVVGGTRSNVATSQVDYTIPTIAGGLEIVSAGGFVPVVIDNTGMIISGGGDFSIDNRQGELLLIANGVNQLDDLRGRLFSHNTSASVHFLETDIDFSNLATSAHAHPEYDQQANLAPLSAASREQDNRVREYADTLESPSANIINRANEYTDTEITYTINNLTLPTSASQDDLRYEINNLTLPTSASIEDLDDIRRDVNTFTSPNSASQDDLRYEINNLLLPTSASQDDLTYEIHNLTLPTSASIEDLDDIRRDVNTFTIPNSASQDDLRYEINNLTLPTSASIEDLNDIRYDLNTFTSPNSASQDDLHYELSNLTLPTSASLDDVQDVDGQLATHLASASVHFLESSIDIGNIGVSAHTHPPYGKPDILYEPNDGQKRVIATTSGMEISGSSNTAEIDFSDAIDTLYITNRSHGGSIQLRAEDTGGVEKNLFVGDPNGRTALYINAGPYAGTKAIETWTDDANNSGVMVSGGDKHLRMYANNLAGDVWEMRTDSNGFDIYANETKIFDSIFNGSVGLAYNGNFTFTTYPDGIRVFDSSSPQQGVVLIESGVNGILRSLNHGSEIYIQAENNTGVVTTLLHGDPDGATELYYGGNKVLETWRSGNNAGIILTDGNSDLISLTLFGSNTKLLSTPHGSTINLVAENTEGLERGVFYGDPDAEIQLYYRGVKQLETTQVGLQLRQGVDIGEISNDLTLDQSPSSAITEKVFRMHTLQLSGAIDFNTLHTQFYQSTLHEIFNAYVKPNGNGSSLVVSAADGGSILTAFFQDGHTQLTIPASGLSIRLDPGSRTVPKANFIYIDGTTKELTLQSGGDAFPQTELAKVAYLYLLDDDHTTSAGALVNQNWNDELNDTNGHLSHITENIRLTMGGAHYHSGITPTINITTNGGEADNVDVSTTSGVAYQMHRHLISAQDTSTGSAVCVVNDNTTPYKPVTDLNNLLTDATGASMSDRYFNLVVWGVGNKTGQFSPLLVNLPGGSYFVEENAITDVDGYDVYDMPHAFNQDSSTGFLIARFTFKHSSAQFGTWTLENTSDLRGLTPGTIAGAGGIGQAITEFTDTQFKILDDGDTSKTFQFEAGGISTATNRTLTVQDSDGTIALISDLDVLQNELNTFTIPNSASQDDLHYELSNLTLPTSASQDDLTYVINNLTLPTSASLEDVQDVDGQLASHLASASVHYLESDIIFSNIIASAHGHPTSYSEQGHTHPASEVADDRISDGDNIVRTRDTDNVVMVSAGGQTVAHYSTDGVRFKSAGTQTLQTTAGGIVIGDADRQAELTFLNNDFTIKNLQPLGDISLTYSNGERAFWGRDNSYSQLYFNGAGTFQTANSGFNIIGTGTTTVNQISNLNISNITHGFGINFYAENTTGVPMQLLFLDSDPNEGQKIFHPKPSLGPHDTDEVLVLQTVSAGIQLLDDSNSRLTLEGDHLQDIWKIDGHNSDLQLRSKTITISGGTINFTGDVPELNDLRYDLNTFTIPNSASLDDLHYEISNLTLSTSASLEDVQDVDGQLASHLASGSVHFLETEIDFVNLATSAHSHPQYDAHTDITSVSAASDEKDQRLQEQIDWRLATSAAQIDHNDLRYDINTFTLPNSASQDDLHYELSNLTLPTSASLEDIISVSAASREQDQRLLEQIIPASAAVVIGQDELSSGITSAAIVFALAQSDQNYTISTEIINTIDNPPSIYSSVIIKKGFDEFRILFSGSLDSDNYKLDWTLLR